MKLLMAWHGWSKKHTGGQEARNRAVGEEAIRAVGPCGPRNRITIQELTGSGDGLWGQEGQK